MQSKLKMRKEHPDTKQSTIGSICISIKSQFVFILIGENFQGHPFQGQYQDCTLLCLAKVKDIWPSHYYA